MIHPLALATAAAVLSIPAVTAVPHHVVHKVVVKKLVAADGTTKTNISNDPAAKAIIAGCGEQRFETQAEVDDGGGHKRVTRIKLCAKPGEDQAAWLRTLRQARSQVGHLTQLPSASRAKLAADFDKEIARVGGGNSAPQIVPAPAPADPALIAGPPK
ncbi:MAG: hypothetical protein M3N02_07145 [Pseudomonadota bacterium]|nr:hypothetical protein [Pseudomonadota bacterium]